MLQEYGVEDMYVDPFGFSEVLLKSQEHWQDLLKILPIVYESNVVHIVPWKPLVSFKKSLNKNVVHEWTFKSLH